MNCQETGPYLEAYFDEELDLVRSLEIEKHVSGCTDCSRQLKDRQSLRVAIKSADLAYHAPESLARWVQSQGSRASAKSTWASLWNIQSWAPACAMAALLAVAYGGNSWVTRATAERRISEEVVSAHVRSLMVSHLTDVASSNQHTVKPWFNGKLDFAPAVRDLTEFAFPLIGGRLDYIAGRPVAALVYRRQQHYINIFLWPSPKGGDRPVRKLSVRGYNLLTWTHGGMNYWAVSDLNAQELQDLTRIILE